MFDAYLFKKNKSKLSFKFNNLSSLKKEFS
jgi:hypothetical protein